MTHNPIPPSPEPLVAYIVMARGRNGDVLIWDYDVPGNGLETNTAQRSDGSADSIHTTLVATSMSSFCHPSQHR
jgi:hypothetical protein